MIIDSQRKQITKGAKLIAEALQISENEVYAALCDRTNINEDERFALEISRYDDCEIASEIVLLRRVFENARSILRYYGVDKKRFFEAYDNLDDSCEMVKRFDEGNDDA